MIILFTLVPLGLVLCLLAVWAFFWAVNTGQFDNLDTAAEAPLEDDPRHASTIPKNDYQTKA
jgi:cbb3-type cytochrome oxidase maturation protein